MKDLNAFMNGYDERQMAQPKNRMEPATNNRYNNINNTTDIIIETLIQDFGFKTDDLRKLHSCIEARKLK